MVASASPFRRTVAPPSTARRGGFPPKPDSSLLAWAILSALVHVAVVILLLISIEPARDRVRPLPPWATALATPRTDAPIYVQLPSARGVEAAPTVSGRPVEPSVPAVRAAPMERAVPIGPIGTIPGTIPPAGPRTEGPGALPRGEPGVPSGAGGADLRSAAERLRPAHRDPRLWVPLPEEIVGLSEAQQVQFELDLAIAAIVDSMAVLVAAGRRATDWTYTDAQGRRWGVSPGQLHLGGITIPLPFAFSAPQTAEVTRRIAQDAEIAGQADRAAAHATLQDRAAEIRRRRDAERTQVRADTTMGR